MPCSLRRAKFSAICREVGLKLWPRIRSQKQRHRNLTAGRETGQVQPISRRRSPPSPARVKAAARVEITKSGRKIGRASCREREEKAEGGGRMTRESIHRIEKTGE